VVRGGHARGLGAKSWQPEFETASAASRDLGAPSNEIQYTALATLVLSQ